MKCYCIYLALFLHIALVESPLTGYELEPEKVEIIQSALGYRIRDDMVQRIKPKGFRISIPYDPRQGVLQVRFSANIEKSLDLDEEADFTAVITEPTNDRWVFDNINSRVERGTTINYRINIKFDTLGMRQASVLRSAVLSSYTIDITPRMEESPSKCTPSVTTVGRRPACKGELIFEENFDTMDPQVWKKEIRIPLDSEDYPFVSFQNRSENCYIADGQLHILPTLLSEAPGFPESLIQTGYLQLSNCTPIEDMLRECTWRTQFSQIIPPIVSAKITTKDSFTFRYGRVEIRTKLPRGDWVYPMISLDPLENYYGYKGYASGQIRVAYLRGNEVLRDKDGKDISNKLVSGGVLLANRDFLPDIKQQFYEENRILDNNYHTYWIEWSENVIKFGVDENRYGYLHSRKLYNETPNSKYTKVRDKGNLIAPFDREFFLTLGVSVGGHRDFPDGCLHGADQAKKPWRNFDPKAMLNFWKDRQRWRKSWGPNETALHVDYIKVYAL